MKLVGRLFWSSRPISWINTAFPFAAAYFFLGGELNLFFWVTTFFFLIPYNLLMYGVNDVFDYESDLRNPRKGGIEGALLPPEFHKPTLLIVSVIAAPFLIFIASQIWSDAAAIIAFLTTIYFVIAYSLKGFRYKEIPLLDSVSSAIHFVGPMVFAIVLLDAYNFHLFLATAAFFLWGVGSHAFGAIQDIRADREAGIASIATAIGARRTVLFSCTAYLLAGLILLFLPDRFVFAALAAIPYLIVVGREFDLKDENCERANRGWKLFLVLNFIAGAIITSLLIGPM